MILELSCLKCSFFTIHNVFKNILKALHDIAISLSLIKKIPLTTLTFSIAMVYFENKIPAIYEDDLMNEDEVLEWLVLQKNSATIEEVTDEILTELIETHEYVVVYFTGECEEGDRCDRILEDLENIDDELDEAGIIFVTTEEMDLAKKYGIKNLPKLAFFRNKDPLIYEGDLADEDEVLAWLTDENTLEIPGKIEEVNMKMLEKILAENDHIVVFFCEFQCKNLVKNSKINR